MVRLNPAQRDENNRPTSLGVSYVDNITPIEMRVDPVTGYLLAAMSGDSITIVPATKDKIDENDIHTVYGISNEDGTTLIPIRTDSNGVLLCQTT